MESGTGSQARPLVVTVFAEIRRSCAASCPSVYCSILTLMKRILPNAVLLVLLSFSSNLYAAEKQYEAGRIVTVEKKFHERVLYYLVNTPITQDDPYYEVTLRLGNLVLLSEFTPRHAADDLPDGWTDNAQVQIKVTDRHHLWVKRDGGVELQLLLVKSLPATAADSETPPVKK